jgi:ppGpp synthetase/RelA/SpoT-type nucleotidyltranferase
MLDGSVIVCRFEQCVSNIRHVFLQLMNDFCRQYPGKENSLFSMIILKREEIIEYAKKKVLKIRNKEVKTAINDIIGLINGKFC